MKKEDNRGLIEGRSIYSKRLRERIDSKIKLLGISNKMDTYTFLNIRVITSILVFILVFISFKYGYILSIFATFVYYFLFEYIFLDNKIKKRKNKLDSEAIYFFEVLTLSLQTGRNLKEAIDITVNVVDSELSLEFKEAMRGIKYGKSLTECLNDLEKSIPSDSVNNIILSLTQANLYGSSIIETMYNQVDYLRERRKMEIKSIITKIPIKISVISVFFFIPLILIIILGPILIRYIS